MEIYQKQEYREFANAEEAEAWGATNYPETAKMSVDSQKYASLIRYMAGEYININTALRDPECSRGKYKKYLFDAKIINSQLRNHCLPENIVVFRYKNIRDIKRCARAWRLKKGIVFSDDAFCSTTLVESALQRHARNHMYDCVIKIYLPRGMSGVYASCDRERDEVGEECEFLLPSNMKFQIIDIRRGEFGMKCFLECKAFLN